MVNDRSTGSSAYNINPERSIGSINFNIEASSGLARAGQAAIHGVSASHVDFELSQSKNPLNGTVIRNPPSVQSTSGSSYKKDEERKISSTGQYNIEAEMEKMGLGNDSDNYSDDFYSDEDNEEGPEDGE